MMSPIHFLFLLIKFVDNYNLDLHYPIIYENVNHGSRGSYFGLSVALRPRIDSDNSWALQIGAPRANLTDKKFKEPGGVYRCLLHGPCKLYYVDEKDYGKGGSGDEEYETKKDEAFIGVSMDVKEGTSGGKNVICGHRWANNHRIFTKRMNYQNVRFEYTYLMTGACYLSNNTDDHRINPLKIIPLVNKKYILSGQRYYWALGQAGISVDLDDNLNTVIMGAPGVYREGRVIKYDVNSYKAVVGHIKGLDWYSYAGYQVGKGKFYSDDKLWYLAGAPRSEGYRGKVILFQFKGATGETHIHQELDGVTLGEYFGAALAVTDINNDGRDDIIVGAPTFSSQESEPDQGKIYVFLGTKKDKSLIKTDQTFIGKTPYGRFGSCIAALEDLDQDGYKDVAVGAPYENYNRGAVYIYRGGPNGLQYSMKIFAQEVFGGLRGFGMSISKGADIDGNSWRDVAVGSYLSDQVVLLRSRPVIFLHPSIQSGLSLLDRNNFLFLKIDVCSRYDGANLRDSISVKRFLQIDPNYKRIARLDGKPLEAEKIIQLQYNKTFCEEFQLFVIPKLANNTFSNPVEIILTNDLVQCSENKKKILFIRNGTKNIAKEDEFNKWCPVETREEVSIKIPFAGECGADDKCEADLEISCSISEARNDFYVVGRTKYITLLVNIKNNKEPAYNTKILVNSNFNFDPNEFDSYQDWKVDETYKNVTRLDIDNLLGAKYQGEIKLKISTERIEQRKFTQNYIEFHVKANSASVENTEDRLNNECKVSIGLLCDIEVNLLASSSPSESSLSEDSDNQLVNFTHYYEVEKFGDSPAGDAELTINIPVRYLDIDIVSTTTESSEHIQQWYPGVVTDSSSDVSTTFKNEPLGNNNNNNLPDNRTLFLNCSSPNVECTSLDITFPNGIPTDISSSINIYISLNYSALDPFLGDKDIVHFTTNAVLKVPQHFYPDPLVFFANTSTTIFKQVLITKPIETYIIALSVLGGGLLLSLIFSGLLKSDFFRRKKREELKALKSTEMFEMQQKFIEQETNG